MLYRNFLNLVLLIEPHPPFLFWHSLNGVAECGAVHILMVNLEKSDEIQRTFLSHFAKHPTYSFMHEVVRVGEMDGGIFPNP